MSEIISQVNDKMQEKNNLCEGGRYLKAIDAIPDLSHLQYRILHRFTQGLNFNGNFQDWRYIQHETMATWLHSSRTEINRKLGELEKEGWIASRRATVEECAYYNIDKRTLFYRLTPKVFLSYQNFLNLERSRKEKSEKNAHILKVCEKNAQTSVRKTHISMCVERTLSSPSPNSPSVTPSERERHALSDSRKSGTKPHETVANVLSYRLGYRFKNERAQSLMLACERAEGQILSAVTFLSKFGQVFTKSDLSTDQSIVACLQTVIDATPEKIEELKCKYVPGSASAPLKEEVETSQTTEKSKEYRAAFRAKYGVK